MVPDAEERWYVKQQIAPIPDDEISLDKPLEENLEKLDKYFRWVPL